LSPPRWREHIQGWFIRAPWPAKALVLVAALQALAEVASVDVRPFVYFQF
jgi:hypothetical protein